MISAAWLFAYSDVSGSLPAFIMMLRIMSKTHVKIINSKPLVGYSSIHGRHPRPGERVNLTLENIMKMRELIPIITVIVFIVICIVAWVIIDKCSCEEMLINCYCSDHYVSPSYK